MSLEDLYWRKIVTRPEPLRGKLLVRCLDAWSRARRPGPRGVRFGVDWDYTRSDALAGEIDTVRRCVRHKGVSQ